jgi:hypothetical protein
MLDFFPEKLPNLAGPTPLSFFQRRDQGILQNQVGDCAEKHEANRQ